MTRRERLLDTLWRANATLWCLAGGCWLHNALCPDETTRAQTAPVALLAACVAGGMVGQVYYRHRLTVLERPDVRTDPASGDAA